MRTRILLSLAVVLSVFWATVRGAELNNKEVEFNGAISSVVANGEGVGTLFVHMDTLDVRVIVNSRTELLSESGSPIQMSSLVAGDEVQVTGKFSSSGVLASQIQLLAGTDDAFKLRGHITRVQPQGADTLISLLSLDIVVNSSTQVEFGGVPAPASDLRVGTLISAEGTTSGNVWTATFIEILHGGARKREVRFQGVIQTVAPQLITVLVDGTAGVTTVHFDSSTHISGDLTVGALVALKGTLNADFSVDASAIDVLSALELKPDEARLKVGDSAVFTVKLRETAVANTTVTLASSDTTVLSLSVNSVVIPQGAKAADFSASALKIGSAVITAQALGQQAEAEVIVGQNSAAGPPAPGAARVSFAPDHIRLDSGQSREVVLVIQPPQKATVPVQFAVNNGLVSVLGSRGFNEGAAALKVLIQAGSQSGTSLVTATLPAALGGGTAELLVEISQPQTHAPEKAEIAFRPDSVQVSLDDSRSVNLMLSRALSTDVVVTVTGGGSTVETAATVLIPAGTKQVKVTVAGKVLGKATLVATLPASQGGATAKLSVEVRSARGNG